MATTHSKLDQNVKNLFNDFVKAHGHSLYLASDQVRRALVAEMVLNRMTAQENQDQPIGRYVDLFHGVVEMLGI